MWCSTVAESASNDEKTRSLNAAFEHRCEALCAEIAAMLQVHQDAVMQRLDRVSFDMLRSRLGEAPAGSHEDERCSEADPDNQPPSRPRIGSISRDLILSQQHHLQQQQIYLLRKVEDLLFQEERRHSAHHHPQQQLLLPQPLVKPHKDHLLEREANEQSPGGSLQVEPYVGELRQMSMTQQHPPHTEAGAGRRRPQRPSRDREEQRESGSGLSPLPLPRAGLYNRNTLTWRSLRRHAMAEERLGAEMSMTQSGSSDMERVQAKQSMAGPLEEEESVERGTGARGPSARNPGRRRLIVQIVDSNAFECFFAALIVSNSLFVGFQVDLERKPEDKDLGIYVAQTCYATFFTIELVMRICAEGKAFLAGPKMTWNCLDALVVVTTLIELFFETLHLLERGSGKSGLPRGLSNVRVVRILRIVRLVRVVRVARVLRFIHALRTFIYSIMATLKALVWAMLLLLIIIYVFGILLTQSVQDHCQSWCDRPENMCNGDDKDICPGPLGKYWGNLPKSMFTLFKSITDGLSWDAAVHPLHNVGEFGVICFTCYISFTYLAVLNVVTGIFCQSAIESAQQNEDLAVQIQIASKKAYVERIRKVFQTIDDDGSATITQEELQEHLRDDDMQAVFSSLEIETADAQTLFTLLDSDGKSFVECEDFVAGLMRLRGNAKRADVVELDARMKKVEHSIQSVDHKLEEIFGRRSHGGSDISRLEMEMLQFRHWDDHPSRLVPGGPPAHLPLPFPGVEHCNGQNHYSSKTVAGSSGSRQSVQTRALNGDGSSAFEASPVFPQEDLTRQSKTGVKRAVTARADLASRDPSRVTNDGSPTPEVRRAATAPKPDIASRETSRVVPEEAEALKLMAAIEKGIDGVLDGEDREVSHF